MRSADIHNRNGIGTYDFIEGNACGFEKVEVLAVFQDFFDQVDQDFGIRIAVEGVSSARECLLQGVVILNDPVVNEGELPVTAEVRVGVYVVGRAMRCPAGVANTEPTRGLVAVHVFEQVIHLAFAPVVLQGAVIVENGNSSAVVAAVFQPFQAFDEEGESFLFSQIPDDSAHVAKIMRKVLITRSLRPGNDELCRIGGQRGIKHHLLECHRGQFGVEINEGTHFLSVEPALRVDR